MFELPKLSYGFNALEPVIDAKTMEIHYSKHHAGYIKKLNVALEGHSELMGKGVEELLEDIKEVPEEIRQAVINNGGGHANHSLFWDIMIPGGKDNLEVKELIGKEFNGIEEFKAKFKVEGMKRFGSGWVWLVMDKKKQMGIMSTGNQDSPLMLGKKPILGLDLWEHAYYLKYQNKRDEYIDNFWKILNWEKVEENYLKALKKVGK